MLSLGEHRRIDNHEYIVWGTLLFAVAIGIPILGPAVGAVVSAILIVVLFSYHLEIGWYILVVLSTMIHWVVDFSKYPQLSHIIPGITGVQGPIGDFFAISLIAACAIYMLREWLYGRTAGIRAPGWKWMILFFASAFLSLYLNVSGIDFGISVKYVFRFIVFAYLCFFVLGATLIRSSEIVRRSLLTYAYTGVAAACMGVASFFVGASRSLYGFLRANPFAIDGWMPFGDQHIFFGEIFVVAGPILLYFWSQSRDPILKKRYGSLAIFVYTIALLTFSRTTWIVCILQGIILWIWFKKSVLIIRLKRYFPIAVMGVWVVASLFLLVNLGAYSVHSSTETRWQLTDMAIFLFFKHPIVGNGAGMFYPIVHEFGVYQFEIGDITDAHGIIQKIAAEQGIIGLFTFGMWLWWLFSFLGKKCTPGAVQGSTLAIHRFALLIAFSELMFQTLSTQYYSSVLWVPLVLAWSMVAISREHNSETSEVINFLN